MPLSTVEPVSPELIGYTAEWSVRPGDTIEIMVSTTEPSFDAQLVRLIHGDAASAGPGFKEEVVAGVMPATRAGRIQLTRCGSYGATLPVDLFEGRDSSFTLHAWVQPTRDPGYAAAIMSWGDDDTGFGLFREPEGDLSLRIVAAGKKHVCRSGVPVVIGAWVRCVATFDAQSGRMTLSQKPSRGAGHDAVGHGEAPLAGRVAPIMIAAHADGAGVATGHFSGKIDRPAIYAGVAEGDLAGSASVSGAAGAVVLLVAWDFSVDLLSSRVPADRRGQLDLELALVNTPARAVTGHNWRGAEVDHRLRPAEYAAIHFHDDDLEDAGWQSDLAMTLPADLPSGIYAVRLRASDLEDHIPLFVRPRDGVTARSVLIVPTLTYLAYANERLTEQSYGPFGAEGTGVPVGAAEVLTRRHPEWGLSLYDVHSDGSGSFFSTRRRPIPNLRPRYHFWCTGGPERLSEDLCIVDWLHHLGEPVDIVTDEDVHNGGVALLQRYDVVMTGCHPEYVTEAILDAVEGYVEGGGRLMYLGGNGYYWAVSLDPERPHIVEHRRGVNGSRTWESAPGETFHTNGEAGGLWRYRGRSPNRLVGVGYTAASNEPVPSVGYVRCPDSFDPRADFIFEEVGADEEIGNFGLIMNGAAGYEIDRLDLARGTPPHALRLATSQGRHTSDLFFAVEDMHSTQANVTGADNEKVRADMVYIEWPEGGRVFSVGSVNWCGSLSHNGYQNNVARITGNVLRGFLNARGARVPEEALA